MLEAVEVLLKDVLDTLQLVLLVAHSHQLNIGDVTLLSFLRMLSEVKGREALEAGLVLVKSLSSLDAAIAAFQKQEG